MQLKEIDSLKKKIEDILSNNKALEVKTIDLRNKTCFIVTRKNIETFHLEKC